MSGQSSHLEVSESSASSYYLGKRMHGVGGVYQLQESIAPLADFLFIYFNQGGNRMMEFGPIITPWR